MRPFLKHSGYISLSFYGAHLVWVGGCLLYFLGRNSDQYLGTNAPGSMYIFVDQFLCRALLDPILFAIPTGFAGGALIHRFRHPPPVRWLVIWGIITYGSLNAGLLMLAPGALVAFPLLKQLPFALDFLLLAILPIGAMLWLLRSVQSGRSASNVTELGIRPSLLNR